MSGKADVGVIIDRVYAKNRDKLKVIAKSEPNPSFQIIANTKFLPIKS